MNDLCCSSTRPFPIVLFFPHFSNKRFDKFWKICVANILSLFRDPRIVIVDDNSDPSSTTDLVSFVEEFNSLAFQPYCDLTNFVAKPSSSHVESSDSHPEIRHRDRKVAVSKRCG